ncbi:MAG: adenine phosphoribosyltransferase [Lachnospiraceae bacterium]|nr:adenine phosphoribosyltransferase [Lachnospiraceae bacterium]
MKKLEDYVLTIPDFPVEGIMFRDITSVIGDADGLSLAVDELQKLLIGVDYDGFVGIESRGFIFGAPLAYRNHKPLLLCRKKGKLPRETEAVTYDLEYGTATIEMHKDDVKPGMRLVVVDDLIATGGSAKAACELVEKLGGEVAMCLFVIELKGLNGREVLKDYEVGTVIQYEGK